MSHIATTSTEALHSFNLTTEEVINISASLTSDICSANNQMSGDFLLCHLFLLHSLLSRLNAEEKMRVPKACAYLGVKK